MFSFFPSLVPLGGILKCNPPNSLWGVIGGPRASNFQVTWAGFVSLERERPGAQPPGDSNLCRGCGKPLARESSPCMFVTTGESSETSMELSLPDRQAPVLLCQGRAPRESPGGCLFWTRKVLGDPAAFPVRSWSSTSPRSQQGQDKGVSVMERCISVQ